MQACKTKVMLMGLVERQSFVEFPGGPGVRIPRDFTTEGLCSVAGGGTKLIPQALRSCRII